MHSHTLESWQHTHKFSVNNEKGKQRTQYVLILTAITMVAEIATGSFFGSMALLADFHKLSHITIEVYECKDGSITSC